MSQLDDFWKIAWDEGRTRFHQADVNPALSKYFDPNETTSCLVPLCGKSLDLLHLAEKFDKVVGVEMVEMPIIQFFEENNIAFEKNGNVYRSEKIDLFMADFINDQYPDIEKFDYIYDRASMVAIEEDYRPAYVKRIQNYMHESSVLHLVTFERDVLGGGPPFDITDEEVSKSYEGFKIETKASEAREFTTSKGEEAKVTRRIYKITK
jgi:thiopurine S-methyltransferase